MPISVIKCIRCHFGNNNPHYVYMKGNSAVPEVKSFSDLGIIRYFSNDSLEHISNAIKRTRSLTIWFNFTFVYNYKDTAFLMQIFQLFVKPILMSASPSWSPWQRYLRTDI